MVALTSSAIGVDLRIETSDLGRPLQKTRLAQLLEREKSLGFVAQYSFVTAKFPKQYPVSFRRSAVCRGMALEALRVPLTIPALPLPFPVSGTWEWRWSCGAEGS